MVGRCHACKCVVTAQVLSTQELDPTRSNNTDYYYACPATDGGARDEDDDEDTNRGEDDGHNIVGVLDVRGAEPEACRLDDQWCVEVRNAQRQILQEVDLSEDWCEYDEAQQCPLAISGASISFERVRKGRK
ncbi:hypothetical protein STCU_03322 [Strigomonas culicis]|uniref:Uncharacterized protein n=1 Tax=Strigomonas culicis TaxID=28005 RepID=S9US13_9TRYP|nr:hypothetical protein STCU_03322 [Strigomonas culicis]|eukprot:EPY31703.1 hypothetical protein STCU_03322 [Strigomonas culicis]